MAIHSHARSGLFAFFCKQHNATPRTVYNQYLSELKNIMRRGTRRKAGPD